MLAVAQLAGIMGAKRTAELIPLCHPLALSAVKVELACRAEPPAVEITATCRVSGPTGVEMEALCAVERRGAHGLRHVQGGRSRHGDHRHPAAPQGRRQVRARSRPTDAAAAADAGGRGGAGADHRRLSRRCPPSGSISAAAHGRVLAEDLVAAPRSAAAARSRRWTATRCARPTWPAAAPSCA